MASKAKAKAEKVGEQPVVSRNGPGPASQTEPLDDAAKAAKFEARRAELSADTSLADVLGVTIK